MLLPNGNVFVTGGLGSSSPFLSLSSAEMYDPVSGRWTANGSMATNRLGSVTPFLTRLSGRSFRGEQRGLGKHHCLPDHVAPDIDSLSVSVPSNPADSAKQVEPT